jgi:hypothetical protein
MTYPKSVGVECAACATELVVLPATLFKAIGDLSGVDGELQLAEVVVGDTTKTGSTLTIADVDGGYTCPKCGERGQLPSDEELYRLEAEQRQPPSDASE